MQKHIRLVSPVTAGTPRDPAALQAFERPDLRITRTKITRGPASVESAFDDAIAVPDTLRLVAEAEREGVHAVVIDCMGDPGLEPARELVAIPVLGPCETAMHTAAMLGHRFAVVTVLERLIHQFENQARRYGVAEKLASVRAVGIPVLELHDDPERLHAELTREAARAVEYGARAIIFGCTGMFGSAEAVRAGLLAKGLDVPVINPIPTAIQLAAGLAELGLSHSKRTWPLPPAKPTPGYEELVPGRPPIAAE